MPRKSFFSSSLRHPAFWVVVAGLVGGSFGSFVMTMWFDERLAAVEAVAGRPLMVTTTVPQIQIVPVESYPTMPAYPSTFLTRRSPVLSIVKRIDLSKAVDERFLARDRTLANAIALTSDGWLATVAAAVSGQRMTDLAVVWDGKTYAIDQAIRDAYTGAVFLKISARDLPVTAFVRSADVVSGTPVWIEPFPQRLYPDTIVDIRARSSSEGASSEKATRRFLVTANVEAAWRGSAAWDAGGQLVGLLEVKISEGWSLLPASNLASGLNALLAQKEIRHASLGLHALDLGSLAFASASGTARDQALPQQGAWLKPDRRAGIPAIAPTSPAQGVLKEGDVIERIERDILDGTADLGERLLEYRSGTDIKLYGQRQSQSFEATVRLGSVVTSEVLK